jgi:hypothetical protein
LRPAPFAVAEEEAALTFYTHSLCPYAHRVALCLAEKAIPHHRVHIDLSDKPAWFLTLNRRGLVPAIGLGEALLMESIDLCWQGSWSTTPVDDSQTPVDDGRYVVRVTNLTPPGSECNPTSWWLEDNFQRHSVIPIYWEFDADGGAAKEAEMRWGGLYKFANPVVTHSLKPPGVIP